MRINITSVMVKNQEEALKFYTGILGFEKKHDFPAGEAKWLTVVSPDAPDGTELLLEPMGFAPAVAFQKELHDAGIPWTSFEVDDVQKEYERLSGLGVRFQGEPAAFESPVGMVNIATFDDTCGNLIMITSRAN